MPLKRYIAPSITFLKYLLLASSAVYAAMYLVITWYQIPYPFLIDWTEGNMFMQSYQILQSKPMYSAPSIEYTPNLYTPLYFTLTALMTFITEADFIAGRLVSFLSTLALCALIYISLRKERVTRSMALVSVGVYLSMFEMVDGWYNLVRCDSLMLVFLMLGIYLLRSTKDNIGAAAAGLAFAMAFYTKQQGFFVIAFTLMGHFFLYPRRAILTGFVCAVITGLLILTHNISSDGWYWFYTYEVPRAHDWEIRNRMPTRFTFLIPLMLLALVAIILQWRKNWKEGFALSCVCAGGIVAALVGIFHVGGWHNNYMPACLIFTWMGGKATVLLSSKSKKETQKYFLLTLMLLTLHMGVIHYNPVRFIPKAEDIRVLNNFMNMIRSAKGDVLIFHWTFIQTRYGKKSYYYGSSGWDVLRMNRPHPAVKMLYDSINNPIVNRKFEVLFLEGWEPGTWPSIRENYHYVGEAFPPNTLNYALAGVATRPSQIWLRNRGMKK